MFIGFYQKWYAHEYREDVKNGGDNFWPFFFLYFEHRLLALPFARVAFL
jgi:hypothetical protein